MIPAAAAVSPAMPAGWSAFAVAVTQNCFSAVTSQIVTKSFERKAFKPE